MSELTTLARPYAKAAFDFAVEKGELVQWAEMLAFTAEIARDERVKHMLDASYSAEKLADIFITVGGDQLNDFGQNLIKMMAENKRLKALPEVCEQFLAMRAELEKEVDVQVTSATALSEEQQQAISEKLTTRFERKVKLNCSVDEAWLPGLLFELETWSSITQ